MYQTLEAKTGPPRFILILHFAEKNCIETTNCNNLIFILNIYELVLIYFYLGSNKTVLNDILNTYAVAGGDYRRRVHGGERFAGEER